MLEPTPELAAKLDADRREAALAMTFEERALGGVEMFDLLVDAMRGVFRMQNPDAEEPVIEQLVLERLRDFERFESAV
jgi:hypothetical protein